MLYYLILCSFTDSPFRKHINRAILELKELTILDEIKKKWWEEKYNAQKCEVCIFTLFYRLYLLRDY